jgi:hypothetical protein
MNTFTQAAILWFPGSPETNVPGTLSVSPDEGVRLSLIGAFEGLEVLGRKRVTKYPVLHGTLHNGRPVTLWGVYRVSSAFSGGTPTAEYAADMAFDSVHFDQESTLLFDYIDVHYTHLTSWVNPRGLETSVAEGGQFHLHYTPPADVSFSVVGDRSVQFDLRSSCNVSRNAEGTRLREEVVCRITPVRPCTFQEIEDSLFGFRDLLALVIAHPVEPVAISGKVTGSDYEVQVGEEKMPSHTIANVYYRVRSHPDDAKALFGLHMLLPYSALSARIEDIVNRWFDQRSRLKPTIDLFTAVQREVGLYTNARFLFMAQAIETYHRRSVSANEGPSPEHIARLEEIIAAVPPQHQKWLSGRLTHSHEPILQKRLKDLLERHAEAAKLFIPHFGKFIETVTHSRNYHTHYIPKLENAAATDSGDLYDLSQDLKLLLEIALLHELGVTSEELVALTKKRLQYGHHHLIPFTEPSEG